MKAMAKTPETSIQDLLVRLERWLVKHRARYIAGLNPPATAVDLKELATKLGRKIPEELASLLGWHNGQGQQFIAAFEQSWLLMSCQGIAAAKTMLDPDAAATGWRSAWIPFLDDDAGDYLCLDEKIAVRAFWLGNKEHPVVASSLTAWLHDFVENVERGKYEEEPERGTFLRGAADVG
jgi:cell wall assembly regulator SMI1